MVLQSRKFWLPLLGIEIVLLWVKFFTAIITYSDDPTTSLVVRKIPALTNQLQLTSMGVNDYLIILSDENELIGESLYYFMTSTLWWLVALIGIIFYGLTYKRHNVEK